MNNFEKLIEYIINDEDQKARELFHDIVVEKSRDIYESIMDEEQMGEEVHGDQVGDMVDEISQDESVGEGDDLEGDEEGFGGEEEFGSEEGSEEFGSEEGNPAEQNIEDQVMNIDAKLDELLSKFDEIMGGEEPAGDEFGGEEPAGGEFDSEPADFGGEEEQGMMEGENPFANSGKSGKSGSGKSGSAASGKSGSAKMEAAKAGSAVSGKSGSAKSGTSGKSGSGKMESRKGTAELMREYVDRIGDIYGGQGDASEGDAVGAAGKKTAVNTKYTGQQTGPDFGGKAVKVTGGTQNQDGTSPTKASNEYNKGQTRIKGSEQNVNVPGGNAGKTGFKTKEGDYSTEHGKEGQTTDGSVPVAKKSVQKQNTGVKR